MTSDSKVALLRSIPLFQRLGKRELERLAQVADEVDVPSDRVLMREGERGAEMFVIASGRVRVDRKGERVDELGPGDWLGEMAIVSEGERTATATTTEPAHVFVLTHSDVHAVMDDMPTVRTAILECVADRIRKLEGQTTH